MIGLPSSHRVRTDMNEDKPEMAPEPEVTAEAINAGLWNPEAEAAAAEPEAEVVVAPAAEAVAVAEEKGKKSKPGSRSAVPSSLGSNVFVQMQALVCCGGARNSGSVASVQHRLLELGYTDAGDEKRGYFGVNTCAALKEFQKDSKIESDSCCNLDTIEALFEGTKVEVLP